MELKYASLDELSLDPMNPRLGRPSPPSAAKTLPGRKLGGLAQDAQTQVSCAADADLRDDATRSLWVTAGRRLRGGRSTIIGDGAPEALAVDPRPVEAARTPLAFGEHVAGLVDP